MANAKWLISLRGKENGEFFASSLESSDQLSISSTPYKPHTRIHKAKYSSKSI